MEKSMAMDYPNNRSKWFLAGKADRNLMKFKKTILLVFSILGIGVISYAQEVFIGTTMGFTDYLENECGIIFSENDIPTDPFASVASRGASIVRFRIDLPPYSNSYSEGIEVDYRSVANVKTGLDRAKNAGLKTLLTFAYVSFALEDNQKLNPYVAPLAWQSVATDLNKIKDSVYTHTFTVLDEYCSEGHIPAIVSIGNESTWQMLMPNVPENELPEYDPARSVGILNAGAQAVRDIAAIYDTNILVSFHMSTPVVTKWWLETHWPYNPDFDIMGLSLYYGWYNGDYAGYGSLGDYISGMHQTYGIELMVLEIAQLFRQGGNDNHVDILGTENIPPGYINPPTTETQDQYLTDITREVLDHGGLGTIVWGGEWVACDCYIYADQWGKGSSWENKAFWDFDMNLHEGTNWMQTIRNEYMSVFDYKNNRSDFFVYPNPITNNSLFIKSKTYGSCNIVIRNILGQVVLQKNLSGLIGDAARLNLSDLDNGVYILTIRPPSSGQQVYKVIKK